MRNGGLVAHLGINDGREIKRRIAAGDEKTRLIFEAMGYNIAKEIAAMAVVVCGKVDWIILTGGLAYSDRLVNWLKERTGFITPINIPGEDELQALAEGGHYGVLTRSREAARIY